MQTITNPEAKAVSVRKRVLIAEDNEDISIIFSYALNQNFEVLTAANGQEALDIIEQNAPDLLVLDINMPRVSGLDVIQTLQNLHPEHPMKIVVATGNSIAASHPLMEFADMTLIKPISPSQLAKLVERLLA